MKAIEYLVKEHDQITKFLDRFEEECLSILNDKSIDEEFFRASISFIKEFEIESIIRRKKISFLNIC